MTKLLHFTASWCVPCQQMAPILEEIDKEQPGVRQKVDIELEENGDLVQKYGVMSIPTFIVVKDGDVIWQKTGIQTKKTLEDALA